MFGGGGVLGMSFSIASTSSMFPPLLTGKHPIDSARAATRYPACTPRHSSSSEADANAASRL
jgi:hypothetical protein